MNIGEYIQGKIDKYNKDYIPKNRISNLLNDKDVRDQKSRYNQISSKWSQINNNDDVQGCLNAVIHQVDFYSDLVDNDKPLSVAIDSFEVYFSICLLLYALEKVAKHYNSDSYSFNYTEQDVDNIFNQLITSTEKFNNTVHRYACWD